MNILKTFFFVVLQLILINAYVPANLLNTDIHTCIRCICHAVSGCYILKNCARYSINYQYWQSAGAITVNDAEEPINESTYQKCMNDDNCILRTIHEYAQRNGEMDCNCNGKYDCADILALHFDKCSNPRNIPSYLVRKGRFTRCSKTTMVEPTELCIPQAV